jgi:type IV pilus modification protein PilV
MTHIRFKRSTRGFSLLEVLVAVVIVSVGLVALAALQLSLIRSSNTAKMQSTALSLAKQQIEQLRSFRQLDIKTGQTARNPSIPMVDPSFVAANVPTYVAINDFTSTGNCSATPTEKCIVGVP